MSSLKIKTWLLMIILLILTGIVCAEHPMSRYNVIWASPSKDATGQMPLGNGDIAAGVYAIENGDLYMLLSKNDAYTYSGDIFKTGRVKISIKPNPFVEGTNFTQTLDIATGTIIIQAGRVRIRIWADANNPVYHIQIDAPGNIEVTANSDLYKRIDNCKFNVTRDPIENPTQDVRLEKDGQVIWYYAVGDRSVFNDDMKYYDVEHLIGKFPDPYRFKTFGNLLESPDLQLKDGALRGKGMRFDIRIHSLTKQSPNPADWVKSIQKQAARIIDVRKDYTEHIAWWSRFWDKSWIIATDNSIDPEKREKFSGEGYTTKRTEPDGAALVSQSYNVFRFLMACQSRGRVQVKFNGGLFTQPLISTSQPRHNAVQLPDGRWLGHEDARDWGRRFTYQNQRLLYWPLLMSGDGDLMQPFFNYYFDVLPVRKEITKAWFGHDGVYYRENIEPTGAERDCGKTGKPPKTPPGQNKGKGYYHSYYFTNALETLAMMTDYVNYTNDTEFRDNVMVPFAREVLLFFDKHYLRDENGKLRIDPDMVLETWWIAVNSAPDVSGLTFCLDQLIKMNAGSPADMAYWKKFRAEIPDVHLHQVDGRTAIAPALEWSYKRNSENGLLYPVFPFRLFGLGHGTEDIVAWTMEHRTNKNAFNYKCWTQDQIHWAYCGNAAEAANGLIHRFRHASGQVRFPLYGSAGPDSCPDFDHFGSGSTALQRMIIQEVDDKILLLPAWPDNWDVNFKLHLSKQTTIKGRVIKGKLTDWSITPKERKKDVILHKPQYCPPPPAIPNNSHKLKIGIDQSGGNRFKGQVLRATVFDGIITPEKIALLAKTPTGRKVIGDNVIGCLINPKPGDIIPTGDKPFTGPASFEAWIKPAKGEAGRIFDKLTPGVNNGFLIDTHPGQSIRVIAGSQQKDHKGVLKPDTIHHIAVIIADHQIDVYLDGRKL